MFLIEPPLFPSRPVDPTFPWQSGPALKTSERAPNAPDTLAPRTPCRMALRLSTLVGYQSWGHRGVPGHTWPMAENTILHGSPRSKDRFFAIYNINHVSYSCKPMN